MPIKSLSSLKISIATSFALLASISLFALLPTIASAHTSKVDGRVYVLNNTTSTNSISIFNRYSDGALAKDTLINIGGRGTGSTLGSQGSLQLSTNGQWLFAVDAGSNQVSVLRVNREGGLALTEIASSQGINPVSLTYSHGDLYVANNGDSTHAANIAEFLVSPFGKLVALPKGIQTLSTANPAIGEIRANPLGTAVVVTEKSTNLVDRYDVLFGGRLGNRTSVSATTSAPTPYGFAFSPTQPNQFVVSDATSGAATSFALNNNIIQVLDGPVASQQLAPCWVAVSNNGQFAYVANNGSHSVSAYTLNRNGHLALLNTSSIGTTSEPVDITTSATSNNLYTLNAGNNSLTSFSIQQNGKLQTIQQSTITLPTGSTGIAAN